LTERFPRSPPCKFGQEGAEAIELEPGALIFFPESTMGVWVIETTVRKVYVLL
jgi:uncharacterized cupin superfamily protein